MSEIREPARIECLPVEIIQTIFLHCVEFNFPRASIHIARALSDPVIYTWLIRLAFTIDNHETRDILTPEYLPPPLDFHGLSKQERTDLQNAILGTRWCTLPVMRKCQAGFLKHVISIQCNHLDIPSPEDKNKLSNLEQHFEESTSITDTQGIPRANPFEDLKIPAMREIIPGRPDTYDDCVLSIWFNSGLVVLGRPVDESFTAGEGGYRLPACPSTAPRMPDKLLRPPYTPDKLSFLTLLAEEAYIDEDENFDCSRRILRRVIRDRDLATFQRLLKLCIRLKCYNYSRPWPLLPCHFRAAMKYAEERNDPFIRFLVEECWYLVPEDIQLKDELLRRYAKDNAAGVGYK
ncbi:uncharacterized protein ACHE_50107S [Aspergillus chevalieri]|uniref:Uncharacterized protein n=1 Tax=Aspergillus chevalieri TaxID=182096 RepID=A0A7R7ZPS1_ASPCH|nr:uncharacterized protein ACHE_50107S [Aspergillus chevalieri]BCR88909.1 hypothetical protein ACHE_50107S [Aspergillus chevalieri]